jgi:hypothetical protein
MNWARPLKRVCNMQIEVCARCGGKLRINASVGDPHVIARFWLALGQTTAD